MDTALKAPRSAPGAPEFRPPLPPGIDRRTRPARRLLALAREFAAVLGRLPSETEAPLVLDAAALALESETLAARAASGEQIDPDLRVRVSGALGRALERLGLSAGLTEVPKPDPVAEHRKRMGWDR